MACIMPTHRESARKGRCGSTQPHPKTKAAQPCPHKTGPQQPLLACFRWGKDERCPGVRAGMEDMHHP